MNTALTQDSRAVAVNTVRTDGAARTPDLLPAEITEKVLLSGDLAALTPAERVNYYGRVCHSLGLNPFTKPFEYLLLKGKLTLYARRDAAEQLRKLHGVDILDMQDSLKGDTYVVKVTARDKTGRTDMATGAVPLKGLHGEDLANAYMKAETKAKRRVTLSICGLGWLDETEVEDIAEARTVSEQYVTPARSQPASTAPRGPLSLTEQAQREVALTQRSQRIVDTFKAGGVTESAFKGYLQARFHEPSTKALTEEEVTILLTELTNKTVEKWIEVGSPKMNETDQFNVYLASRYDVPDVSTKSLDSEQFALMLSEIGNGTVEQFLAMPAGEAAA